jgi:hypothetical protein
MHIIVAIAKTSHCGGSGPSAPGGGSGTPCHSSAFGMVWTSSLRSSFRGRGAIAEAEDIGRRIASRPKSMWKSICWVGVAMAAAGIQQLAVYTARRIVSDTFNEKKGALVERRRRATSVALSTGRSCTSKAAHRAASIMRHIHSASLLQTKMVPGAFRRQSGLDFAAPPFVSCWPVASRRMIAPIDANGGRADVRSSTRIG